MARIIEERLRGKIQSGLVDAGDLHEALAHERNNLEIVTLPTVGAFSAELAEREAAARQKLSQLEEDAKANVPLLEALLTELGASTETYVCAQCGKHRTRKTCSMCYEPSEY